MAKAEHIHHDWDSYLEQEKQVKTQEMHDAWEELRKRREQDSNPRDAHQENHDLRYGELQQRLVETFAASVRIVDYSHGELLHRPSERRHYLLERQAETLEELMRREALEPVGLSLYDAPERRITIAPRKRTKKGRR